MQQFILLSIILVEGFVSIATEIITIRQLLPVVGNSVDVTSYIIGIFLLALAYGYKRGGKYQGNYAAILRRNFVISSVLLGIGLSYSFVTLFFMQVHTGSLIIYLLLVTAPLAYLLGQTLPITMNLFNPEEKASSIGSRVLHLSTIGSFLGAILTTVLFMNYLGVTNTILLNSMLLSLAALIVAKQQQFKVVITLIATVSLIFFVNLHTAYNKTLYSNAYNTYQLIDEFHNDDGQVGKLLVVNNSGSSFLSEKLTGSRYIEMIKKIIFYDLNVQNQEILVLGAGGFSLSADRTNNNKFIYVDIDPDMQKVTEQYFLQKINGEFVVSDARQFLLKNKQLYPIIVADTYSNRTSIPSHLLTAEYFSLIKNSLAPNGTAIINVIINPMLNDRYSQAVDNTIRSVFASCMSIPKEYADQSRNVLYVCNKKQVAKSIYTDNHNRASLDKLAIN